MLKRIIDQTHYLKLFHKYDDDRVNITNFIPAIIQVKHVLPIQPKT